MPHLQDARREAKDAREREGILNDQKRGKQPVALLPVGVHAEFYSCSRDAVIRVYDAAGTVIETHE
jgi:hypothetical protein